MADYGDQPEAAVPEGHRAEWDGDSRVLSCSCGSSNGYMAHIAALLGTDENGARVALLATPDNTEVNPGACGGCETCGSSSASVHCPVCGHANDPCLTYYVAAGRGPTDEGGP